MVPRDEVINELEVLQRRRHHRVRVVADPRVERAVRRGPVGPAVLADHGTAAAPDAPGVRVGEQHLPYDGTVPVADVHRVEPRECAAAALGQGSVDRVAHEVQAPGLGERRHELGRAEPDPAAAHVQPVEGSRSRQACTGFLCGCQSLAWRLRHWGSTRFPAAGRQPADRTAPAPIPTAGLPCRRRLRTRRPPCRPRTRHRPRPARSRRRCPRPAPSPSQEAKTRCRLSSSTSARVGRRSRC